MQVNRIYLEEAISRTDLAGEAFVSPPEAQRILGVSPMTLKRLVKNEGLPKPRLVRDNEQRPRYAFLATSLVEWIRSRPEFDWAT